MRVKLVNGKAHSVGKLRLFIVTPTVRKCMMPMYGYIIEP